MDIELLALCLVGTSVLLTFVVLLVRIERVTKMNVKLEAHVYRMADSAACLRREVQQNEREHFVVRRALERRIKSCSERKDTSCTSQPHNRRRDDK